MASWKITKDDNALAGVKAECSECSMDAFTGICSETPLLTPFCAWCGAEMEDGWYEAQERVDEIAEQHRENEAMAFRERMEAIKAKAARDKELRDDE